MEAVGRSLSGDRRPGLFFQELSIEGCVVLFLTDLCRRSQKTGVFSRHKRLALGASLVRR